MIATLAFNELIFYGVVVNSVLNLCLESTKYVDYIQFKGNQFAKRWDISTSGK